MCFLLRCSPGRRGPAGNAREDPRGDVRVTDAVAELSASANGTYDLFVKDLLELFGGQLRGISIGTIHRQGF